MNIKSLLIILFITISQLLFSQTQNIELTITNIDNIEGEILIAVYNNENSFMKPEYAYRKIKKAVKSESMKIKLVDMPKGEYSIALFHDKDLDGELKRNFFGIPSEDYGFSNITSMLFSRPSYEDTRFYLESDTSFVVELQ